LFWLLGTAILVVMLAALDVATGMGIPDSSWITSFTSSTLIIIGIIIALIMMFLHDYKPYFKSYQLLIRLSRQIILLGLACLIIAISVLQVLINHHSAQDSQITQSLRVQALVRIEGLSDSVMTVDSGYRQGAIIEAMLPMTEKLSSAQLDQLAKQALDPNSPWQANVLANPPRVLLQAYPKPNHALTSPPKPKSKAASKFQKKRQNDEDNLADKLNGLKPNEIRLMTLTLKPLAQSNEVSSSRFDSYRWLRSRHIDGTAQIQAVSEVTLSGLQTSSEEGLFQTFRQTIDHSRFNLRQHFYQDWETYTNDNQQAWAVTLSLLTGDRSLINRDTKELYQVAGISHLLAISGTHVLFLALILAAVVSNMMDRFWATGYQRLPRWQWRFLVMVAAAFLYALFTGFDVPAARTAWTLLAVGLVRVTLLPISTRQVMLGLAVIMAWFDPMVLWQAGYWLSFIAVALLLAYEEKHAKINSDDYLDIGWINRVWQAFKSLFKLQCWLFLALLPVTLLLFGKVSLWGLVVNLFAIGVFGWLLVPLNLLAGILYLWLPAAADQIWQLLIQMVTWLHQVITWITGLVGAKQAWLTTVMTPSLLLITGFVLLPWLLPRGLLSRYLAIPPLILLVMTVNAQNQALIAAPTLYILPTNDTLISAAVLQYPLASKDSSANWLILSDHRPVDNSSWQQRPSQLSGETLAETLINDLQRLNITRLDGMIVQSADDIEEKVTAQNRLPLLPTAAAILSEKMAIHHYWQAGKLGGLPKAALSAQPCQAGKIWQPSATDNSISIEAMTGWAEINDSRVWDCSVKISSQAPIQIVHFNAVNPKNSEKALPQAVNMDNDKKSAKSQSIILDSSRHPRSWQLWQLLCANQNIDEASRWLGHSRSQISIESLTKLSIDSVVTYDKKPLDALLANLPP